MVFCDVHLGGDAILVGFLLVVEGFRAMLKDFRDGFVVGMFYGVSWWFSRDFEWRLSDMIPFQWGC